MNPTIKQIHQHGSVRNFKPASISDTLIETIVAAGQRASTSSNLQMYSVVVVSDAAKRAKLQEYCGDQKQIGLAPVFLAWCADLSRLARISQTQGHTHQMHNVENFLTAAVDTAILMQTAGLAAESLGLGFCFIGGIRSNPQAVIDLLQLPPLVFPISGMTLGWPVEPPLVRPRLPLGAILHHEMYSTADEGQHLAAYDDAMIATGIYDNRQVDATESMSAEAYGWQEHSARRVARNVRPHLRGVLNDQGFPLK